MKMRTTLQVIVAAAVAAWGTAAAQTRTVPNTPAQHRVDSRAQAMALDRLQDVRMTLARITEHSMSQDAREALGPLTTAVDRLWDAYTGETRKEAQRAAETAVSSPAAVPTPAAALDWHDAYRNAQAAVTRMIGPRDGQAVGTSGSSSTADKATAGTSVSNGAIPGIPRPAMSDLQRLRSQLDQFYQLAAAAPAPKAAKGR
jgi:hypothetical protein